MVVRPYFTPTKAVLPLDKVLSLEPLTATTFRSIVKAYSPTGGENGTYGGHVFAQAAWAAAQTVAAGLLIHNITGYFILGGKPNEHFIYSVKTIRDGHNYSTRTVTAIQNAGETMFTCTCSFKRDEPSPITIQANTNLKSTYSLALTGKENEPMLHPAAPSNDSDFFREEYLPAHPEHFNPIAGLHLRKADMTTFNAALSPLEKRQLTFYSLRGSLPLPTAPFPFPFPPQTLTATAAAGTLTLTREANLHACAHLYASDRNSLFIVPNHLGRGREFTRMASLSHSVVFHVGVRELLMPPEPRVNHVDAEGTLWEGEALALCALGGGEEGVGYGYEDQDRDADGRKWWVQEAWMTRAAGGRGLHVSRLWDYERGVHIATTFQDGLIRFGGGKERGGAKM